MTVSVGNLTHTHSSHQNEIRCINDREQNHHPEGRELGSSHLRNCKREDETNDTDSSCQHCKISLTFEDLRCEQEPLSHRVPEKDQLNKICRVLRPACDDKRQKQTSMLSDEVVTDFSDEQQR